MNKFMAMALCCGMFFSSASLDAMRKRSASESFECGDADAKDDQEVILVGRVRTGLDMGSEVRTLIEALTQDQSDENARPLMDVIKEYLGFGVDEKTDQELLAIHMDDLPLLSQETYDDFVAEISMNSKEDLAAIFESSPEALIMVIRVVTKNLVTHAPQDSVLQIMNVFIGGDDALSKFSEYKKVSDQLIQRIEHSRAIKAHLGVFSLWATVKLAEKNVTGAKAALVGLDNSLYLTRTSLSDEENAVYAPYFDRVSEVAQGMIAAAVVDGLILAGYMMSFRANPRRQPAVAAVVDNSDGGLSSLFGGLSLFGNR